MMMKKRLWRVVTVCLLVFLPCWHPTQYVGCTEQPPEARSMPAPAQDSSGEEDPGDKSHHRGVVQVEEGWGSQYVQYLSEEEALPEGEEVDTQQQGLEEEDEEEAAETPGTEVDDNEHVKTLDLEDSVAEKEQETARPEARPEAEQPPPEAVVTQEQKPTPASDLSPPPSATALNPIPEDPSSTPSSSSSVPEEIVSDVPLSESSDADLAIADCEAGETNPFDGTLTSLPVVLENTSNALGKGTKTDIDPPPAQAGQALVGLAQGANASHMLKEQGLNSHIATETVPSVATKDPEDNPTFDEWKKKMMEVETEKTQATHTSTNSGSHAVKKVQKNFNNYASVECGAKILGSNPEAKSTSAILMESMDHYMLNPCSNKIWFIIELCDPIQVKQLDIANFELFSSTPKDFLVSISDRYPTNKWVKRGTFHARDERTVQSFPLDEHLYTKYVKVELVSHHGSEHFCPLSLVRVFGTSMVEEYEEIADPLDRPEDQDGDQDDHLDYPPGYVPVEDEASNDLIGSAKDVILNMVNNIKVNVLGGGPGEGNFSGQAVNMTASESSSDPDTTSAVSPVPDTVGVEQSEVPEHPVTTTEDHTPEPPTPEPPVTEEPKLKNLTVEEPVVTPIEEGEVQSIVTMLEEEEEEKEEEGRDREVHHCPGLRQQESLDYCGPSSSYPCSCSASFQEYLLHQCYVQRNCTSQEREPEAPPVLGTSITPSQHLTISPTATQTPQQPHTLGEQPQEREASSALGERAASPTQAPPHLPWVETEAVGEREPSTELPHLEPSQTSILPRPSSTDIASSATRPTPTMEPSHQASSKDLPGQKQPATGAEKNREVQQEENRRPFPTVVTTTSSSPSGPLEQSWRAPVERPCPDVQPAKQDIPVIHTPHVPDPLPPVSTPTEQQQQPPAPTAEPESAAGSGNTTPGESRSVPVVVNTEPPSRGQAVATETKGEAELVEDILFTSSPNGNGQQLLPPPSPSDFYAELHKPTEQANGNPMHGSTSQKESVFMRLNNRIKALEMNMSLSGRYLEQLSQRYRRQMEEMQRAFNKTIIKLQNTSRIAEEQDQRQTESIQSLQGQLEDITQLVLNLSVGVSQLQSQVSERQSYLLLCLVLCLFLGLLLCVQHSRMSAIDPPSTDPAPPIPKSYSYCCPERRFWEYEDMSLKRGMSYPLLHSGSFQVPTTEGPESPHTVEPLSFLPANKKKKRSKMKTVETLKCTALCAPLLAHGAPVCNSGTTDPTPRMGRLSHHAFMDPPSGGSSESSSQSDEPSLCGLAATSCTRLCDGLPRSRAEKRAFKRHRSKPGCVVVEDLLQAPQRDATPLTPTLQDLMGGGKELSAGMLGVTAL